MYWHTGGLHGYQSSMLIVPAWSTAVYLGVNGPNLMSTSGTVQNIMYYVLELLQGHEPWVNVTSTCPEGWDAASPDPVTPDPSDPDYNADDSSATDYVC